MSLAGFVDLHEQLEVDQRIHELAFALQEFTVASAPTHDEMPGLTIATFFTWSMLGGRGTSESQKASSARAATMPALLSPTPGVLRKAWM